MEINRILLISAPIDSETDRTAAVNNRCFFHLGLLTIATRLKHFFPDIEIRILEGDLIGEMEKIKKEIEFFRPEIIGVSVLTPTYKSALEIAEHAKLKVGVSYVVFGNDHASFFPELILEKRNFVDFIIKNDNGDEDFVNFVGAIRKDLNPYDTTSNLYGRLNNLRSCSHSHYTPIKERLCNLDFMPNFKIIGEELYFRIINNYNKRFGKFHEKTVRPFLVNNAVGCRNCNNRCLYCSIFELNPDFGGAKLFWDFVERYYRKYGINFFFEACDSFTGNKAYIRELINYLPSWFQESDIELMVYADALSVYNAKEEDFIETLKRLHIKRVNMGLDSGDDKSLRTLKGYETTKINKMAVKRLTDAGIQIHCSFIIGCPGESWESMGNTVEFIKELITNQNIVAIEVSPLFPLPNSRAWELFLGQPNKWFRDMEEINRYLSLLGVNSQEELWTITRENFSNNDIIDISLANRLWIDYFTKVDYEKVINLISQIQTEISSSGKVTGGFA